MLFLGCLIPVLICTCDAVGWYWYVHFQLTLRLILVLIPSVFLRPLTPRSLAFAFLNVLTYLTKSPICKNSPSFATIPPWQNAAPILCGSDSQMPAWLFILLDNTTWIPHHWCVCVCVCACLLTLEALCTHVQQGLRAHLDTTLLLSLWPSSWILVLQVDCANGNVALSQMR